jgi:ribosome-binding ATPase YchF (GTP1/OBG family)
LQGLLPPAFITINGKLESEITDLNKEERQLMLNEHGLNEPGLNSLIKESYKALDLQTFFTCNKEEVRARTIAKGASAVQAAEEVHTDFAKKFIKAEIYNFDDAIKHKNNIKDLKTLGLVKIVGKDYIMQEGDIAYFIKGQ